MIHYNGVILFGVFKVLFPHSVLLISV